MRKVMLTVVGLVGLALLCGSGELVAQTGGATGTGNTVNADATDSRLQGVQTQDTGGSNPGVSFGTSGVGGSGRTANIGMAVGTQSVQALQQEVVQLRQEVAQLRAQLDSANANAGVGGSGQAGVAPSASSSGSADNSGTDSSGTGQQGTVAGGLLRARRCARERLRRRGCVARRLPARLW